MTVHITDNPTRGMDEAALIAQSKDLGSITLGQSFSQSEAEQCGRICDDVGCRLAWKTTAFDEGFMSGKSWDDRGDWWPEMLAGWATEMADVVHKTGRDPDYIIISTENKTIPSRGSEEADAGLTAMARDYMQFIGEFYPGVDLIVYAHNDQRYSVRDGWYRRGDVWPEGCDWPCTCPQLYNLNCPVEFRESLRQSIEKWPDKISAPWVSLTFGMSQVDFIDGNPNAMRREYGEPITEQSACWAGQMLGRTDWPTSIHSDAVVLFGQNKPDLWPSRIKSYILGTQRKVIE